jgi:Zn-dependent protease
MNVDVVYILATIVVILFSMTLHEAMHAFASYWLGDDTARLSGRLTLNPIRHIDPFLTILMPIMLALSGMPIFGGAKPVPFNPNNVRFGEFGVAIVALAGPATNFLISFISFGVWALIGTPDQNNLIGQALILLVSVNLGFFVFNMIPIPPLDGSRVLYALAPEFVKRGMEYLERFGVILVFAVILLFGSFVGALMSGLINFFLGIFGHFFGL